MLLVQNMWTPAPPLLPEPVLALLEEGRLLVTVAATTEIKFSLVWAVPDEDGLVWEYRSILRSQLTFIVGNHAVATMGGCISSVRHSSIQIDTARSACVPLGFQCLQTPRKVRNLKDAGTSMNSSIYWGM